MSAATLKLYRTIADAWSDSLRAWCEAASQAALTAGAECWLAVAHRAQARWLRQQALRDGVPLFGVRFVDPEMLRDEMCARAGMPRITRQNEAAEFVLKVAAAQENDMEAVAREPGSCLAAMNDLRAAGWTGTELDIPPDAARLFAAALARSQTSGPDLDQALLRERPSNDKTPPLWTCVVGWDAERWPDIVLLEAVAAASARCSIFLPLPRIAAEKIQQQWIETLETRLRANREICSADELFHLGNDALVSRLEKNALTVGGTLPRLLVGRDWTDQVTLVRDEVLAWLTAECASAHSRLAIIAPDRSASSVALVQTLSNAGVELLDETGETLEPEPAAAIAAQAIRYHLQAHDAVVLLEICKGLHEFHPETWRYLYPAKVHAALTEAFCTVQSRNARLLVGGESAPWRQIEQVVASLGKWEGDLDWTAAREKWSYMLAQLGVPLHVVEPLWSRTRTLFENEKISARSFLEYMAAVLAARESRRAPEGAAPHARVVVTTLAGAVNQTWDRVIFLDSNEGVWPQKPDENPLLDDAARAALNACRKSRGYLLTSGDRWALEQARLVDLVEHCSGEIVFAAAARDPENPARETQPNEWVIRCLSVPGETKSALDRWREAVQVCAAPEVELSADERAHLEKVHASRRDPGVPFDRYLFNFHESRFVPDAWSATRLDLALTCPATFALREIFRAEAVQNSGFERGEGGAVGAHVHAWLARAFGAGEELQPFHPEAARAALEREIVATLREMTARFQGERLALPLWWETCLRKAAWAARRCLAPMLAFESGWFYAMEKNLRETVATAAGPLRLKGRVDLLLADRSTLEGARVVIVDFKTGKSEIPTPSSLNRGSGHQFCAYYLMGKNSGATEVSVGVIRPTDAKLDVFTDDVECALREAAAPFARMQRDLSFGRRGPLVADWGACERLPMATVPLDPEVLTQKAAPFSATP